MSDTTVPDDDIELQLLGTPRLVAAGRPMALGSRKALALLAVLVLDGGAARARLAALLWPDQDEAGARRNLRREVFRLRGAGVPVDDRDAQRLALGAGCRCDVLAAAPGAGTLLEGFERLAGDDWRDWLEAWRARLGERGRAAREQAAATHEARGDWDAALAVHHAQLDADPTNETAAQQALRLCTRLGRRDAGLALFARLESALHHQLGLAPLPATLELVRDLRDGRAPVRPPEASANAAAARADTVPPRVPDAPAPALPARAPFAGRGTERAAVLAGWQAGCTVYLSGPPGIGKSRLAAECAADIGAALFVRCEPDDGPLPCSSAVRALRALIEAAPDFDPPPWMRRELARLLPEFEPRGAQAPAAPAPAPAADGEADRLRLVEAYAQAWQQLAALNFSLVVIDDWQYADAASVQLWSRADAAGAGAAGGAVRRLVVFRSGELPAPSLAHLRRQLDAGTSRHVTLDGLAATEVQWLVQRLAGQAGAGLFAERLHRATGGNPLFVMATIRHLFDQKLLAVDPAGGWSTPFDAVTQDYAELPVPPTARETLLARVHALGPAAARLLEAASLAGEGFDLALLGGTAALDDGTAVEALEYAQASRILVVDDDGRYRFEHDLYRQCVAESLSPARRALLHARLARNLAAAGGAPARIAAHFEGAGLPREAAPWLFQAGVEAARVLEFDAALAYHERALAGGLDAKTAYAAHDHRLMLLHRLHRVDEQLAALSAMAALAPEAGDPLAPFHVASKRAIVFVNSGLMEPGLAHARWIVQHTPDPGQRVRGRYLAGVTLMFMGRETEAEAELLLALAEAPAWLPERESTVCAYLCHLAVNGGDLAAAERHLERGLRVADRQRDLFERAELLNAGYRIAEASGRREQAVAWLAEANALCASKADVTLRVNYLFNLVTVLLNGGDAEAARASGAELLALLAGKQDPKARFVVHLTQGRLALWAGELGRAWRELAAARAASAEANASLHRTTTLAAAQLAADLGATRLLTDALDALATIGPHPDDAVVLVEQALRARAELLAGDAAAALARLQRALTAPRSRDPDGHENADFAQAMLAQAHGALGDVAGARAAAERIAFGPRWVMLGMQARLLAGDREAIAPAVAMLAERRLAPLERMALQRALATYDAALGPEPAEIARLAGSLDIVDADADTAALRAAFVAQHDRR